MLIYYSDDMFEQLSEDNLDIEERLMKCGKNDSECFRCSGIYQDMLKIVRKHQKDLKRKKENGDKNQSGVMSVFID